MANNTYTIAAAARLCHCDRRTLQRAIHAGRLHLDATHRLTREELLLTGYLIAETPQETPLVETQDPPLIASQTEPLVASQIASLLTLLERLTTALEGVWQELRYRRAQASRTPLVAPQSTPLETPLVTPQHTPQDAPQVPPLEPPLHSPQILGTYDPQAAARRMQALRQQGLSYEAIAAQLTAEGIPTRYGLPWQHSSVRYLLKTYGKEQ